MKILARDAGISIPTGYRYLHEGIDVLAAQRGSQGQECGEQPGAALVPEVTPVMSRTGFSGGSELTR